MGSRGERGAGERTPLRRERCLRVGRGPGDPAGSPLCFPVGDVEALARSIRHGAQHPPSAQAMSDLIGKFDFATTAEAIERLWLEVNGDQRTP